MVQGLAFSDIRKAAIGQPSLVQKPFRALRTFSSPTHSGQCLLWERRARRSQEQRAFSPFLPLHSALERDSPGAVAGADEVLYDILFLTNVATYPMKIPCAISVIIHDFRRMLQHRVDAHRHAYAGCGLSDRLAFFRELHDET